MPSKLRDRFKKLLDTQQEHAICGGLRGLEKESLRVSPEGNISQKPHPHALGSALTNPYITTDYSEALLEFITPPLQSNAEAIAFMEDLHSFTYQHLGNEFLWGASMPCIVNGEMSIPIADYGSSNIGQMKHIYRVGLWHRYGRTMQAIAGIHFNYSLPEKFWPLYQRIEKTSQPLTDFVSQSYFDMARNLHRNGWLVLFLFGASPAICKSFVSDKEHSFDSFDSGTLYQPFGTSLRMSDIGYKNDSQSNLNISYNSLDEYTNGLYNATQKSYPDYENIDFKSSTTDYMQLNANALQIENEYYSNVRPKQIAQSGERPSLALKKRGVRYVELRSVDLNSADPAGLNEKQLNFLEAFMIYCLLSESPALSNDEKKQADNNTSLVASKGRQPNLKLNYNNELRSLQSWGLEICEDMRVICQTLDKDHTTLPYTTALNEQIHKLQDASLTPSALLLQEMKGQQLPFFKYAMLQSKQHHDYYTKRDVSADMLEFLSQASETSLIEQQRIESEDKVSFDDFLAQYFSQQ
jgi:glutamate--cysteine ligase